MMLDIEPRVLCLFGNCSADKLYPLKGGKKQTSLLNILQVAEGWAIRRVPFYHVTVVLRQPFTL